MQAEFNVWVAVIIQSPPTAVATLRINVSALFTALFYHRDGSRTCHSLSKYRCGSSVLPDPHRHVSSEAKGRLSRRTGLATGPSAVKEPRVLTGHRDVNELAHSKCTRNYLGAGTPLAKQRATRDENVHHGHWGLSPRKYTEEFCVVSKRT